MITTTVAPRTLLIVDDEGAQLKTLSDIFTEEGFEVCACATFEEALDRCRHQSYAVAILDLRLRGRDGIELLQELQQMQVGIRTIVHTGYATFDSAKSAVNLGAFAYVEKRGDPTELVTQVHRAVEDRLSEALTQSEQRYRDLLNDVIAIVWECELPSWQFTFVSQQAESILGYPVSQWLDEPDFWVNHIHDDDRQRCVEICQRCTDGGEDHEFDYRAIAADGQIIWLHDVVHLVKDENGTPTKLRGVMFDITDRKSSEEALRESEEQRERTEAIALLMTVHVGLDGNWLKVPITFCKYLGYSQDELIGRHCSEATHPDDRAEGARQNERLFAGEIESFEREKRHVRKDGRIVWSYVNCSLVTDRNGEPLFFRSYIRDINENKAAEEALARSETRYRSLVKGAPVCIHEVDLDARLASINPAGLRMVGSDDESTVVGRDYLSFVDENDRARIESLMKLAYEGEASSFEFHCRVDDQVRLFESNFIPIFDESGNVTKLMGTTEDVTERKAAEASLRASEELFRQLAENVNAVVWMRSGDGRQQLYVSPKYEEIWGRSLKSLEENPESFIDAVIPEDKPLLQDSFASLFNGGDAENYDVEYRVQKPDGEIRWIRDRGFSIFNEQGEIVRQAGFAEDVTESRKVLEQIRIRGRAISAANVGIVISDVTQEDRPIVYCNPAFENLTGYAKDEVVGRNCRLLWAGDDDQDGVRELGAAVVDERDGKALIRSYRKDGRMFWNQVSISPVHDQHGRVTHFVGFQHDITDRVDTEWKLRESENRFRTIFEQAAVGVALIETKSGRFVKTNQKYSQLIGYSIDELAQLTFMDISEPEDLDADLAHMRKLLNGEIAEFSLEKRLIRMDGSALWINLTVSPTWKPGAEPRFHIAIVEDISARKIVEKQLANRSRQQAAVAQLGLLALQSCSIDELMDEAVTTLAQTLDVEFAKILELSASGTELLLRSGVGWRDGLVGKAKISALENSQAGYTLSFHQPVRVDSLQNESRFDGPSVLLDHGIVSGVSVVIHGSGRPFGVLGAHTRQHRTFDDDEVNFFQSVANILADAIQRNRHELQLSRARDELEASEAKYRTIVETTQEWIWEINLDGVHTYSNPAVESILGYSVDEVVGKSCLPLMYDEDQKENERKLTEFTSNEAGWSGWVVRWRHKDGSIRYLESNSVPIHDNKEQFCGYRGADRDVTARIEAEEYVRKSERSLAKAQEIASIGSWQVDLLSGQVSTSAELRRMIGASEADFSERDVFSLMKEFIHPDDHEIAKSAYHEALSHSVVQPLEFRAIRRSDDQVCIVRAETEIAQGDDGTPQRIIGTLQDITERKQAELALRESEEKFRVLTEESAAIVVIAQGERLVYCNATLSAVSGYTLDELRRMKFLDIVHPDHRALVARRYHQRLNGEKPPQRYEFKIATKSGGDRWLDFSAQLIDFESAPAVLATCVDVSERKLAEEQLREMETQLAHVSRLSTMGEMVAGIAHEINQPLSAIANFALACQNTINAAEFEYEAPVQTWLHEVNKQAVRCGDIIRRLREFVKKGDDDRESVDLNRVVRDSIALIGSDMRDRSVIIDCRLPNPGPRVQANQVQLQQVLVNLLLNACDATSERTTPEISVYLALEDGVARLTIEDNGQGVEEATRQKLFDAFFTTKLEGMGMGLAISKSIIEAHQGSLRFEPGSPSGARFYVELPLHETAIENTQNVG